MDNKTSGVGFCSILTLVFVILKLCGTIDWSWMWVLAPIWIEAILVFGILGVLVIAQKVSRKKSIKNYGRRMNK